MTFLFNIAHTALQKGKISVTISGVIADGNYLLHTPFKYLKVVLRALTSDEKQALIRSGITRLRDEYDEICQSEDISLMQWKYRLDKIEVVFDDDPDQSGNHSVYMNTDMPREMQKAGLNELAQQLRKLDSHAACDVKEVLCYHDGPALYPGMLAKKELWPFMPSFWKLSLKNCTSDMLYSLTKELNNNEVSILGLPVSACVES